MGRSELEIERWTKLIESAKKKNKVLEVKIRMNRYKGSLILGREFQEDTEQFLKRKDLKKFWDWNPI